MPGITADRHLQPGKQGLNRTKQESTLKKYEGAKRRLGQNTTHCTLYSRAVDSSGKVGIEGTARARALPAEAYQHQADTGRDPNQGNNSTPS